MILVLSAFFIATTTLARSAPKNTTRLNSTSEKLATEKSVSLLIKSIDVVGQKKIEKEATENKLSEVILALSANPEGDHTVLELKTLLKPLEEKHSITISTLGRGLSTGSELEYLDSDTIRYALENRKS